MPFARAAWYRLPLGAAHAGPMVSSEDVPPPRTNAAPTPLPMRNDRRLNPVCIAIRFLLSRVLQALPRRKALDERPTVAVPDRPAASLGPPGRAKRFSRS